MEASTRPPPDPPRVLVVDDEDDITGVLADILEEQGYAVDVAADGDEAWERAQEDPYDVVITDLKMPRMGGLELLREIRRAEHPSIVIMMTGFATVETAIEALKIGAYDYILKPFKVGELLQVVERAMEKIRLEAENLHLREQIALLKLSEAVSSSLSLDEVLRIVVEAACREVGADAVELWFRPPKADGFTRRIGLGPEGETPALLAAPARLEALVNGLPHLRLQGEKLQGLLSAEARGRIGTLLAVPLRRGGQTLGLLCSTPTPAASETRSGPGTRRRWWSWGTGPRPAWRTPSCTPTWRAPSARRSRAWPWRWRPRTLTPTATPRT
ncbi:MAG: response regulator [Deltaproteobacteria bacterium]|nr:response regulator [Deltaproteobacteria bacterium]